MHHKKTLKLNWSEKELQQAQNLIDNLESFSYLKFLIQVIGVVFFANIFSYLFAAPWFFDIVTLNTIFMTMSCFSMRVFLQRELYQLIKGKTLRHCLFADTQLLHGEFESLTRYKMQQIKYQAGSYKKYLSILSHEIKMIAHSYDLQDYETSSILKLLYEHMKSIEKTRPYTSYFYRFFTRQEQLNMTASDLKNIWDAALYCGDNELLMKIIFDVQYGALPLESQFASHEDLFHYLAQGNFQRLKEVLGTNELKNFSLPSASAPQNRFAILDKLAQISYIINFSLIEPVQALQENIQNYHQAGFMLFASALFMSMPISILIGLIAAVVVIGQGFEFSLHFLVARNSLQQLIDAYAAQPKPHYERLLKIKLDKIFRPGTHKINQSLHINWQHLSEIQRFKVYEMILEAHAKFMPYNGAHYSQSLDITAVLPLLLSSLTSSQKDIYLSKLRPLSQSQQQQLQSCLNIEYLIPLQKSLRKEHKKQMVIDRRLLNLYQHFESFVSRLEIPQQSKELLLASWDAEKILLTDYPMSDLNKKEYDKFFKLKTSIIKQQQDLSHLYEEKNKIEQLSYELSLLPTVVDQPFSEKQRLYEQLCQIRQRRDSMMSYVFPLNTIANSTLGIVFYLIPAAVLLGAMTYTVAPAVLLALASLTIFGAYHYFRARENTLLEGLTLADFWAQKQEPIQLKLIRQKIKRLSKYATAQSLNAELVTLIKKIDRSPMCDADRQLLAQILPKLKEITVQKGNQQSPALIEELISRLNISEFVEKYQSNISLTPVEIERELRNVEQLLQQKPAPELSAHISLLSDAINKYAPKNEKFRDKISEINSRVVKTSMLSSDKKTKIQKNKKNEKQ